MDTLQSVRESYCFENFSAMADKIHLVPTIN